MKLISKLLIAPSLIFTTTDFIAPINIKAKEQQQMPFIATFENGQNLPTWSDSVEWRNNVSGIQTGSNPECSIRSNEHPIGKNTAILYSGYAQGGKNTNIVFNVYDVQIPVSKFTKLDYWIYPQNDNARFAAVDLIFTDGTSLRDSGAVDQNGHSVHPSAGHGGSIPLDAWSQINVNIGQKLEGKVIDKIWIEYDRQGYTGPFRGYIDNISITDDKTFSTGFEKNQVQPVVFDYPDWNNNITGIISGSSPEASTQFFDKAHGGISALRYSGISNGGNQTNIFYTLFEEKINVSEDTFLSYWIYPEQDNGRFMGIDFLCTDGTTLRDSGAVDERGRSLHPGGGHGGDIPLNEWTEISSNIGKQLKGKTIDKIMIAYDRSGSQGQFSGYIDDIKIYNRSYQTVSAGPTSPDIRYYGRWDNSADDTFKSYFGGSYFKVNFTGTTAKIKLAAPSDIYVKIDNGDEVLYKGANGIVDLTPIPLEQGIHFLRVSSSTQNLVIKFQGLILDEGAVTRQPPESNTLIEFIGDSVTEGYLTPRESLTSYAWKAGEILNAEHTQIAYVGICLKDGVKYELERNIGMSKTYFKLQPTETHQYSPDWDSGRYSPDIIVINLGSNDSSAKVSDSDFEGAYIEFLSNIRTKHPEAEIFVLRTFGSLKQNKVFMAAPTVAAVNSIIDQGDNKIHFIDTQGWLTEASDFKDNVHPSEQGHDKAAGKLSEILSPYLK
jgi:lysophospholipase L1-like esterase